MKKHVYLLVKRTVHGNKPLSVYINHRSAVSERNKLQSDYDYWARLAKKENPDHYKAALYLVWNNYTVTKIKLIEE